MASKACAVSRRELIATLEMVLAWVEVKYQRAAAVTDWNKRGNPVRLDIWRLKNAVGRQHRAKIAGQWKTFASTRKEAR